MRAGFDRHAPAIYRYTARRLGRDAADDLVAEIFLAAFQRRGRYDVTRADARPWLYGIASRLIGRYRRDEVRFFRAISRTGVDPAVDRAAEPMADRVASRVTAQAAHAPSGGGTPVRLDAATVLNRAARATLAGPAPGNDDFVYTDVRGVNPGHGPSWSYRQLHRAGRHDCAPHPVHRRVLGDLHDPARAVRAAAPFRRGAVRAAALIPGVTVLPQVTDAAGGQGVGVAMTGRVAPDGPLTRYELIFDPQSYRFIGLQNVSLANGPGQIAGHVNHAESLVATRVTQTAPAGYTKIGSSRMVTGGLPSCIAGP